MSYFAAVLVPVAHGCVGRELDLDDVEDLDTLADLLRDESADRPVLMFLEEDDEYVAVVRVGAEGGVGEPRVFVSDRRVVTHSQLAAMLLEEAVADEVTDDDQEDGSGRPVAEPAGDADLLADFGTPAADLLALCAQEGQLPGDIIGRLCERAGCLELLEELRGE